MGRYVFFGGGIIVFSSFFAGLKREFSGYNAAKLVKDILAGLTVCAVALPLALAFGVSSGASAAAGLVTAIVAGIVIALLGGATFQISGPTGAMSAVLVGIVAAHGLQGVFFACFAAGVLLLIAGVLRLGRLISFIPMPVIMGFTSGIAIIIALGQIDNFFGTTSEGLTNIEKLLSYGRLGFHVNWQAALIGLLVVAVMVVWPKKWGARVPGSLVGIILATIVATVAGMDQLAVVGDIPKTLLLADRLSLGGLSFTMLENLLSPIVTIAALGMIESLLCGASASRMKGEAFNADQELIAQGVGNILLPLFGGVPATAAIARTSVAVKSGQQTRLTSVFHSLFLLASMFLLGGVMAVVCQPELIGSLSGDGTLTAGGAYRVVSRAMYGTVSPETGDPMVDSLFTSRGMAGMLNTVWLIITAMIFGGVMEAGQFLERITTALIRRVQPDLVMNIALPYQDLTIREPAYCSIRPHPTSTSPS